MARCSAASAQVSLDAEDIRNEKVKVLRSMRALSMDDVVIGQYRSRKTKHAKLPGYLDDKTVPSGRCGVRPVLALGCSASCALSSCCSCSSTAGF